MLKGRRKPVPADSKNQFKLMAGICSGTYPDGYRGISKKVACEFVRKINKETLRSLPKRKHAKKAS